MTARPVLYTIGHSNVPAERFLQALSLAGIQLVVDVRTKPVSRFAPWANRQRLEALLAEHGVGYVFAGEALGGKPADPALQRDGQPDWDAIARTDGFAEAMSELLVAAFNSRAAVMCSEEDPERCHRRHLIAKRLPTHWSVIDLRTGGGADVRAEPWER